MQQRNSHEMKRQANCLRDSQHDQHAIDPWVPFVPILSPSCMGLIRRFFYITAKRHEKGHSKDNSYYLSLLNLLSQSKMDFLPLAFSPALVITIIPSATVALHHWHSYGNSS
jgi:hypothetical protein